MERGDFVGDGWEDCNLFGLQLLDGRMEREEFLRCDRKIVVGSISPWKVIAYERFLNHITATENYEAWEFLVLFANMLDKKTIQKDMECIW